MTTASVISFLQPGIQPGLKARASGGGGENPFAALLSSLGIDAASTAPSQATGATSQSANRSAQAAATGATHIGLPAPLQFLKDIGEALAAALETADPAGLAGLDELPPEFQALLAQYAQLPEDLHRSLEGLIGTDATAALDKLAAAAGEAAATASAPAAAPAESGRPAPAGSNGQTAPAEPANKAAGNAPPAATPAPDAPPQPATQANGTVPAAAQAPEAAPATATPTAAARTVDGGGETTVPQSQPPAPARPAQASAPSGTPATVQTGDSAAQGAATPQATAAAGQDTQDADIAATATAKPAAQATAASAAAQATAAPVANAAAAPNIRQQTAAANTSADAPATQDAARAEAATHNTTRDGLRGLLETLAAGSQAADQGHAGSQQRTNGPQGLAAAIQAAVSARSGNAAPADTSALAAVDAADTAPGRSDPILLTPDRAGQPGFAGAPGRSVTVTAYGSSLPVSQLAMTITTQARAGTRHFDIRLDPPEMGRIDVRLEMGRDGIMNAQLTVDRPETYDALNRDARHLERMLQQSGMKLDGNSIQFSLRDGGGSGNGQPGNGDGGSAGASELAAETENEPAAPAYARISSSALVDIEV